MGMNVKYCEILSFSHFLFLVTPSESFVVENITPVRSISSHIYYRFTKTMKFLTPFFTAAASILALFILTVSVDPVFGSHLRNTKQQEDPSIQVLSTTIEEEEKTLSRRAQTATYDDSPTSAPVHVILDGEGGLVTVVSTFIDDMPTTVSSWWLATIPLAAMLTTIFSTFFGGGVALAVIFLAGLNFLTRMFVFV